MGRGNSYNSLETQGMVVPYIIIFLRGIQFVYDQKYLFCIFAHLLDYMLIGTVKFLSFQKKQDKVGLLKGSKTFFCYKGGKSLLGVIDTACIGKFHFPAG